MIPNNSLKINNKSEQTFITTFKITDGLIFILLSLSFYVTDASVILWILGASPASVILASIFESKGQ